jgi:hypothetical protein
MMSRFTSAVRFYVKIRGRDGSPLLLVACAYVFFIGAAAEDCSSRETRYIKGSSPRRRWRRRRLPPLSGDDFFRLPPNPDLNTFDKVGPLRRSDQEAINDEA